jgi:CRISPR-associated protein Csb1
VFGLWDSTGPKGGGGAKFARALVSEIIGVNACPGVKTQSRIDPTGIVTKAAEIYVAKDEQQRWTADQNEARQEKGKPQKVGDGRPSEVNHSNVPPSVDDGAGGVTIDYAQHTVVLSLAALRKLGFGGDANAPEAARTVLAVLGLVAVLAAEQQGHDLRSRCLLVPRASEALRLEVVRHDGTTQPLNLSLLEALSLFAEAVAALPSDLSFPSKAGAPLALLKPLPQLALLIRESRRLAAAGAADEES